MGVGVGFWGGGVKGYCRSNRPPLPAHPVRSQLLIPEKHGAHEFLKLKRGTPVILVLGGSQGAKVLNEAVLSILPQLVKKYQILHQTGMKNFDEVSDSAFHRI